MASNKGRRSYFAAGGRGDDTERGEWVPKIDKNPFYRTMDIFNGTFGKKIKLSAGKNNATDLKTIWIDFGEGKPSKLDKELRPGKDAHHTVFMLKCGHEWEGNSLNKDGSAKKLDSDYGVCFVCGAEQVYRAFEHEWQHIIFKSDLAARTLFVQQYAAQLMQQAPDVDQNELEEFLSLLINAFDDLRVNSLWEKVYPGSAQAIWERWRWYAQRMGNSVNESFLCFIFAVAFGVPTDPQGEFAPMKPIVEWAVDRVQFRGFANMMLDVRVLLDRCMGALLAKIPPPPPQQMMQPPPLPSFGTPPGPGGDASQGQQGDSHDQGNAGSVSSGQEGQGQEAEASDSKPGGDQKDGGGVSAASGADQTSDGPSSVPSAGAVSTPGAERSRALQRLMDDPKELDSKEKHEGPTDQDLNEARNSQAMRAMLNKVLHTDISDLGQVEAMLPEGVPDPDMEQQLQQLQNSVGTHSENSMLTSNAKAHIKIIEVTSEGRPSGPCVELDPEERFAVQRMRSAFFKAMGRQKAKRSPTGTVVDVQALIQYKSDHQDPNVFENDDIHQGFAYSVLCDMSGSMSSAFPAVCRATEMLKQALKFPFVVGNLWGFRGAEALPKSSYSHRGNGEVWMYRYAKDVNWYTGTVPTRVYAGPNGVVDVPVRCGGITPMNSAINVASTHLWRKMPVGMAKRMFLLTDGSPIQTKTTGAMLPDFLLRQFVANEIRTARKHGVQVYTIVIGDHSISEDHCVQMFGPRRFWRRVGQERVGTVLASLVLSNFSKYIKARG